MDIKLNYSELKTTILDKTLYWQHVDRESFYLLFATDGPIVYNTVIDKDTADCTDFENNYKSESNRSQNISQSATRSFFIGKTIEMSSEDTSGYCEWEFENNVYIRKVRIVPVDAIWGDKMDFTVHLKANDYEVASYANDIYCYGENPDNWFQGNGSGKIISALKVRATYTKVAGATRNCIVIAEFLI